jgi:hypothetical protein
MKIGQSSVWRWVIAAMLALAAAGAWPAGARAQTPAGLRLLGQIGGVANAAAWAGERLYIGVGPRLVVYDAGDMKAPRRLGQSDILPGIVRAVETYQGYAFVAADRAGLLVLSLADATHPAVTAIFSTPAPALDVDIAGGFAYVAAGLAGLRIVDVSRPTAPVEAARVLLPCEARGVDSDGALAAVVGPQRVAGRVQGSLRVLNVLDPYQPTSVGAYNTPGDANAVALRERVAWIADGAPGLWAISLADPASPTYLGRYNSPGEALDVAISQQIAFLADGQAGGLQVISIANPREPYPVAALSTAGQPTQLGLGMAGRLAIVDGPKTGVILADVAQPQSPQARAAIAAPGYAWDVDVFGNVAYVANGYGGLWTVSVADPARPIDLTAVGDAPAGQLFTGGKALGIRAVGEWAFMADGAGGLRVIQTQSPAAPRLVGTADTPGRAQAVRLESGWAFVADGVGGLRVISLRQPAAPSEVGFSLAPADAGDLALVGGVAYVADRNAGLRAISIADPTQPAPLGILPLVGPLNGMDAAGALLGVTLGNGGLALVSIGPAPNLTRRGSVASLGYAWDVEMTDLTDALPPTAFLADGAAGVRALNVADPDAPAEWARLTLAGDVNAVRYAGGRLYATTKEGGLWIIEVAIPRPRAYLPLIRRGPTD